MAVAGPCWHRLGRPSGPGRALCVWLHPGWVGTGPVPTPNLSTAQQNSQQSSQQNSHRCGLGPRAASPELSVAFTRFGVDFEVFLAAGPGVCALGGVTWSCLRLLGVFLSSAPVSPGTLDTCFKRSGTPSVQRCLGIHRCQRES